MECGWESAQMRTTLRVYNKIVGMTKIIDRQTESDPPKSNDDSLGPGTTTRDHIWKINLLHWSLAVGIPYMLYCYSTA